MSKHFYRFPSVGQDDNSWGPLLLAQLDTGVLSGRLYNSGGALYVPACRIGIDNGSYRGISVIDAAEAVSLAAGSNSNWLAVEMSVSGTAVTFTAADIAGATDPTIIPASVRAAWDGEKDGFYLTATKRLISLAWKSAAGVLLAVVNFDGQKIWASQIGLHTGTIYDQYEPGKGFTILTGDWDMNAAASLEVAHSLGVFYAASIITKAMIRNDANNANSNLDKVEDFADPSLLSGGITQINSTQISLRRRTGGLFDSVLYDSTPYNRGWVMVHMREF